MFLLSMACPCFRRDSVLYFCSSKGFLVTLIDFLISSGIWCFFFGLGVKTPFHSVRTLSPHVCEMLPLRVTSSSHIRMTCCGLQGGETSGLPYP